MTQQDGVRFDLIPIALAERAQWLVWRFEDKPGAKKPLKMPYYVSGKRRTGEQGSAADRAALVDLAAARAAFEKAPDKWTGVGFAFLPDDGLIGVDLDGMIDNETGEISPRGKNIIDACASYTELSPSGKGVHIICAGETKTFKSNEVGVEVFCSAQYFTFTGRHYPGTPETVNPMPKKVLKRLQATVASGRKRAGDGKPSTAPPPELEGRAKVESALAFVSPSCGYEDWIHIGMAICSELGTGAYDVWDSWSAKGSSYPGEKQTAQHWKSFKPGEGVTGATLFKRAMEAGWQPPKRRRGAQFGASKPAGNNSNDQSTPTNASARKDESARNDEWEDSLVRKRGELSICTANVADILLNRPEWAGVLGYDEFEKKTVKLKPPPFYGGEIGDWDDSDDTWTSMWMARTYGFTPASPVVSESVEAIAKKVFNFNPVQDYLNGLVWDNVQRIDEWLSDFMGVEKSEYTTLVGRFFFIALISRAMCPGGQFKYCLILEGLQDAGKSKALKIIGGNWYGDTDMDLHNKDSMVGIQGKWLYEFPEMDTVSRAEASRTKSFLSRQIDEFRPHYGRRIIKCKRQTVFAGSVNEFEYLKDPSGAVRFWPVLCEYEINHDALTQVRDQLFAEALVRWRAGERFWPSREEQTRLFSPQQIKREQQESLIDALHDWVYGRTANFTAAEAMMDCLKLDASKMSRDMQTRVGIALRKLGCTREERRNGMIRYWYKPPIRNVAETQAELSAQGLAGGDHAPPF